MALTKATLIDLNSNELILDLDADTSITADTDDTIHFKIAGADEIVMTGTALTPAVADGSALGSTSLEWSDLFLADGAVINFGADQDINITHVADTGLTTNADFTVGDDLFVSGGLIDLKNTGTVSTIKFYCESSNAHAQSLVSAPHSEAASNTLTLPGTGGNARLVSTSSTATLTNKTLTSPVITGTGTIASGAITSSGIIKTDDATEATSTTDGSLQTDGGLSVAKDIVAGDDVKLLSDSAVLSFGADSDTTLTHTDGSGLTLNSTNKLMFNDASQFIQGASATVLDIAATDEIELTATLIDVVGNLAGSGTGTFAGILKTDDATEATSTTDGSLQTDGGLSVAKDIVAGDDVKLLSDAAVVHFGADSEITLTHSADSGLLLKHTATADDKPINLVLQTGETDMAANDVIGKISFQAPDEGTGTDAILVSAAIQARAEGDHSASSNATSIDFMTGASEAAATKLTITSAGHLLPGSDDAQDLGSASLQFRDIYTGDLNLNNTRHRKNEIDGTSGSWTIQEGDDNLYILNRLNGKKYKFKLEEIQ